MQYTDEQMKMLRLAGISAGYGITEGPVVPVNPSIYGDAKPKAPMYQPEPKTSRNQVIPMDDYDFDNEVQSLVGDQEPAPESVSQASELVMSSLVKLNTLIQAALPSLSAWERSQVSQYMVGITGTLCE